MFNLILAIWLGAILNIGFFHSINLLTPYFGVKAILFLAATVVIVVAAYYAILQILNWKWTAKVVAIILVIVGGFSAYFVNTLGIVISPDQIQNMVQTDAAEISDLISLRFGLWTVFLVVLPIILIFQIKLKKEKTSHLLLKKSVQLSLLLQL